MLPESTPLLFYDCVAQSCYLSSVFASCIQPCLTRALSAGDCGKVGAQACREGDACECGLDYNTSDGTCIDNGAGCLDLPAATSGGTPIRSLLPDEDSPPAEDTAVADQSFAGTLSSASLACIAPGQMAISLRFSL